MRVAAPRPYHRGMLEIIAAVLAAALLISLLGLYAAVAAVATAGRLTLDALLHDNERLERELRAAVDSTSGQIRLETGARLSELQTSLVQQMTGLTGLQGQQLADLTRRIQLDLGEVRGTLHSQLTSCSKATNASSTRCAKRSKRNYRRRSKRGSVIVSDGLRSAEQVTRGWAKCRRWPRGSVT